MIPSSSRPAPPAKMPSSSRPRYRHQADRRETSPGIPSRSRPDTVTKPTGPLFGPWRTVTKPTGIPSRSRPGYRHQADRTPRPKPRESLQPRGAAAGGGRQVIFCKSLFNLFPWRHRCRLTVPLPRRPSGPAKGRPRPRRTGCSGAGGGP